MFVLIFTDGCCESQFVVFGFEEECVRLVFVALFYGRGFVVGQCSFFPFKDQLAVMLELWIAQQL